MKARFDQLWYRVSRIGLREEEGVLEFREVIFLNRMLFILPLVILAYLPVEVYLNGFSMIPVVAVMLFCFMLPLPLHYFRLFRIAHYFVFISANALIAGAGILAGAGVNNHVSLIPVVLMAIIIFKTNPERIAAFFITLIFYLVQLQLLKVISPVIDLPAETRAIFSAVFFVMSLVLSFLIGFYFLRINREYETIVINQKETLADKNKEITASITYARRIQNAILPPENLFRELLPHSFIFYQPKDIVAGDFYWLEKMSNKTFFAAADATGHGVPGAMVSVVCNNALNRSVREFGLTTPGMILDKAREIIMNEFSKSEEDVKDGMDISLCAFNTDSMKLEWAGANNPLLIVRENSCLEFKPDKQPVGKFPGSAPFTTHTIEIKKGDSVYIFSDGYADQFGGESGKKFKYKQFRELLVNIHKLTPDEQKERLSGTFTQWKRELEQVDDICVIGVRF